MYKCLKFFNENRHLFTNLNSNNGTRMKDLYVIPRHRTSFFERSPMYNCIKLYNGLAPNLRTLRGIKFDNAVKKFLIENAFYTVDEFLVNQRLSHNI